MASWGQALLARSWPFVMPGSGQMPAGSAFP
jgi:hypothetical protein